MDYRDPLAIRVTGRSGAGRRTVARALRGAGVTLTGDAETADVDVYVFVETLTADDRAALAAGRERPTVGVLNKADLTGFHAGGPLRLAAERCRVLQRETAVPIRPLSALLAVAGTDPQVLDGELLDALRALAAGTGISAGTSRRLAAELDVVGTALGVAAIRAGSPIEAVSELLRAASGVDGVRDAIDRAGAVVRYRRLTADPDHSEEAVLARMATAEAVLIADMAPDPAGDHLRRAVHWHRYARGPVSVTHRDCAVDAARGALRLWSRAGGVPVGLP